MQTIGTNHKIKPPWTTALERNIYPVLILLKTHYLLVENDFGGRLCLFQQQARQITTPDCEETPSSYFAEHVCTEPGFTPTFVINDPHLPHVVAETIEVSTQFHSVGDVVS